jgi:hypothetical protein
LTKCLIQSYLGKKQNFEKIHFLIVDIKSASNLPENEFTLNFLRVVAPVIIFLPEK